MTFYTFFQKLKHWFLAKNRHGIHSPFTYDFIEQVINGNNTLKNDQEILWQQVKILKQNQIAIIERIILHYQVSSVFWDGEIFYTSHFNSKIKLWIYTEPLSVPISKDKEDIIVVLNAYASKENTKQWTALCAKPAVHLSMDLFIMGILYFRKEFLIKQHFRLKY